MIPLKFFAAKRKIGSGSFMVIIPKPIANLLDETKEYCFTISEKEGD